MVRKDILKKSFSEMQEDLLLLFEKIDIIEGATK
jgi:hypothetical protein